MDVSRLASIQLTGEGSRAKDVAAWNATCHTGRKLIAADDGFLRVFNLR